jgi:hypothetical protein
MNAFENGKDKLIADANAFIANNQKLRDENAAAISQATLDIASDRKKWEDSRDYEDNIHRQLTTMQSERAQTSMQVAGEVDERNKAIDVMVKATFMVCERFTRYKETAQCLEIRGQPDVDEPQRYETKPADEGGVDGAEAETKLFHCATDSAGCEDDTWFVQWAQQETADASKIASGNINPEGNSHTHGTGGGANLAAHSNSSAGWADSLETNSTQEDPDPIRANKELRSLREAADESDVVSLLSEEESGKAHAKVQALTATEAEACKELVLLAKRADLPDQYSLPITELALSLKEGNMARSKSIVEILLEVLKETREEQAAAKMEHTNMLNKNYAESRAWWQEFHKEATDQAALRATMEANRLAIERMMRENEDLKLAQETQKYGAGGPNPPGGGDYGGMLGYEDEKHDYLADYGEQEAVRLEDLENLAKLKSLLRALYDRKMPTSCPKHNRVTCTSSEAGWCIFDMPPRSSNAQRCSCNVGFYGDACQYRSCPGAHHNLYEAGAAGACSDRGDCNQVTGLCTCHANYYHGPKMACDYKDAPPSLGLDDSHCEEGQTVAFIDPGCTGNTGEDVCEPATCRQTASGNCVPPIDNLCSGQGKYDPVRGTCTCDNEHFGPGCEEKMCPDRSGKLYPRESGNSCSGRGSCDVNRGCCLCSGQFPGGEEKACEMESCHADCNSNSGRGACEMTTGHCACVDPYHGHACEFEHCPFDCSGGGNCNRNNGECLCKMGYSGIACLETTRCQETGLNTGEDVNKGMNWWTIWDKPGWIVCPKGQLMYGLKHSVCEALSCIDSGSCAAPCEGSASNHVFQLRHCYHDLRWYNSFDQAGWSKCLPDYFVAGLFRSCESLYCLNMAKCCSLKESRWAECSETSLMGQWDAALAPGDFTVNSHAFMTGLERKVSTHNIKDITKASYCRFVRWY